MFKSIRDKKAFELLLRAEHEAEERKLDEADRKQRELFESIELALTATLKGNLGESPSKSTKSPTKNYNR